MRRTLLLALLSSLAFAQSQSTPRPEDLGTVTGHITCSDTRSPARFARVQLIGIKTAGKIDYIGPFSSVPGGYGPTHTDFTGSYTLTGVAPGQYYLRVDLTGYATPIAQFTRAELNSPTPQIQQRIDHELQLVTVAPNATAQADAVIYRAASIVGTVLFDDGSPAIGIDIRLLRHTATGKVGDWLQVGAVTDGHGQFDLESISPGKYVIQVPLPSLERVPSTTTDPDGTTHDQVAEIAVAFLSIYSGNVFRYKDAAVIEVGMDQKTDASITIPLSRLHQISGRLLTSDGHAINDGRVDLLFPDTREELESVAVHEDGTFHFAYAPEGDYTITVSNARDKTQVQIPVSSNPVGFMVRIRTLRTYGTLEQPLTVRTDIQSLNLTLPDKPTPTASN